MSTYDEQRTNGESLPIWYTDQPPKEVVNPLPSSPVDVVVVGAGISGLSVAYHVLRSGRSVLVLDKAGIGSGETGRTSAHVSNALDDHYHVLERVHGRQGARLAAESHARAIEDIFSIVQREHIACEATHVDGYLFSYAGEPREERMLRAELQAARRAGLSVEMVDAAPLPFKTGPALRFRDQAQFEPMAYLVGLARAVTRLGGVICTGQRVEHIEEGQPAIVHVRDGQKISAANVVVATNTPINDVFAIHSKQAAYRSYVVGVQIPVGSLQRALYWDLPDPYHYVRLVDDHVLIVGGEDHKVGQSKTPEASWLRLMTWTRAHFPMAGELCFRWSGQVMEPADGMAFIGRNPGTSKNVFVVTGDSGNGLTHGALAGILISDLIAGRDNPWTKLYEPSRKLLHPTALREFMRDNASVALHYADWIAPSDDAPLQPGHGTVVRRGVHRVANYLSEQGERRACSAKCPHLGGMVQWNRAERSWDCPLHGSRFSPKGQMIAGPACSDLAPEPVDNTPEPITPATASNFDAE